MEDGIDETLTYCDFSSEHWTSIRTNDVIERLNREIRRTRVVSPFSDGDSALMLVCAQLGHVAGTQWGNKKYMNMKRMEAVFEHAPIAGWSFISRVCKPKCEKYLTLPVYYMVYREHEKTHMVLALRTDVCSSWIFREL